MNVVDATRPLAPPLAATKLEIRVRGRVQGVGFRPTVWRLATELELDGEVLNDAEACWCASAALRRRSPASSIV